MGNVFGFRFFTKLFLDKSNFKNHSFFIVCRNILFHPKNDFELLDNKIKLHILSIKTIVFQNSSNKIGVVAGNIFNAGHFLYFVAKFN